MASCIAPKLISLFFLISISFSFALKSSKPNRLVLPISKDAATLQYVAHLNMGTPLAKKAFVVDIGGRHLWMDCKNGPDGSYVSSTFNESRCGSAACSVAKADCNNGCFPGGHRAGCNNQPCSVLTDNTIINGGFDSGLISTDTISLPSTDGSKSGPPYKVPNFIFGCANHRGLSNLARGTNGMMGLGREQISFSVQLSTVFGGRLRRKFAICLPSNPKSDGVIFLGDSPYTFYPSYNKSKAIEFSSRFQRTRLYINPLSGATIKGPPSPEYFIKVTSILVNKKPISINKSLLEFHQSGIGGTKVSTVETHTKLERTIYQALVKLFDEELMGQIHNVKKVKPVGPFKDCYDIRGIGMSPLGIGVPDIAFVFENNDKLQLELYGGNSMVEMSEDVGCLGFVEDDVVPIVVTPIVIGTHQLQDHLLQFDLASNTLAFTPTLRLAAAECSNFKF